MFTSCRPVLLTLVAVLMLGAQGEPTQREKDLALDLEAAQRRVEELESRVAALEEALRAAKVPIPSAEPTPPAPAGDYATSDAFVTAARALYEGRYGDKPIPPSQQEKEHALALRELARWAIAANRSLRREIEWTVRCRSSTPSAERGAVAELVVVNPKTGEDVGFPFPVLFPSQLARRIPDDPATPMVLRGVMEPELTVNPERFEAGAFSGVPFVGPYCEFRFSIAPRALYESTAAKE